MTRHSFSRVLGQLLLLVLVCLLVGWIVGQPAWVLVVGLTLSVAFMGLAATTIARLLERYHWIAYVGTAVIAYVSLAMIWEGGIEVMNAAAAAS